MGEYDEEPRYNAKSLLAITICCSIIVILGAVSFFVVRSIGEAYSSALSEIEVAIDNNETASPIDGIKSVSNIPDEMRGIVLRGNTVKTPPQFGIVVSDANIEMQMPDEWNDAQKQNDDSQIRSISSPSPCEAKYSIICRIDGKTIDSVSDFLYLCKEAEKQMDSEKDAEQGNNADSIGWHTVVVYDTSSDQYTEYRLSLCSDKDRTETVYLKITEVVLSE